MSSVSDPPAAPAARQGRVVLHVLTRADDGVALEVVQRQQRQGLVTVQVADLASPTPDYAALLEAIFAADTVAVW